MKMDFPRKIYAIQHNVTKKIYIGSSKNAENRYMQHISALRSNRHTNEDMQEDFNKYGENYSFYILEEITSYSERKKEYEWMFKYNTLVKGVGYNYTDTVAKRVLSSPAVPMKSGLPEMTPTKTEGELVGEYVEKICKEIIACEDVSILDLVWRTLAKR